MEERGAAGGWRRRDGLVRENPGSDGGSCETDRAVRGRGRDEGRVQRATGGGQVAEVFEARQYHTVLWNLLTG